MNDITCCTSVNAAQALMSLYSSRVTQLFVGQSAAHKLSRNESGTQRKFTLFFLRCSWEMPGTQLKLELLSTHNKYHIHTHTSCDYSKAKENSNLATAVTHAARWHCQRRAYLPTFYNLLPNYFKLSWHPATHPLASAILQISVTARRS